LMDLLQFLRKFYKYLSWVWNVFLKSFLCSTLYLLFLLVCMLKFCLAVMVSLSLLACMYKFIWVWDFAEKCPSHFTPPYEIQIMREQLLWDLWECKGNLKDRSQVCVFNSCQTIWSNLQVSIVICIQCHT
jgi:hypothetical protein